MATATTTVIVHYDTTNIGRIYLRDVGGRNQMGNGKGIFTYGQDQYLTHASVVQAQAAAGVAAANRGITDATLLNTSDVILSVDRGVIKKFNKTTGPLGRGAFTVAEA